MSWFGFGKPRPQPTPEQMLKAVPHQNVHLRVESETDGGQQVSVPLKRPRWYVPPLSWVLPWRDRRRIQLDAVGTGVLNRCDGQTRVEQIVRAFAAQHKMSFREAQVPVTQFLKMLTKRGVIALVAQKN